MNRRYKDTTSLLQTSARELHYGHVSEDKSRRRLPEIADHRVGYLYTLSEIQYHPIPHGRELLELGSLHDQSRGQTALLPSMSMCTQTGEALELRGG